MQRWGGFGFAVLVGAVSLLTSCSDPVAGSALQYVGEDALKLPPTKGEGDVGATDLGEPDAQDVDSGPGDDGTIDTVVPPECTTAEDCEGQVAPGVCQVAACLADGTCGVEEASDGAACDDGNPCTGTDTCAAGACVGGDNQCPCQTSDDCAAFEDGDACNGTLVCVADVCALDPATVVTCAPGKDPCAVVGCEPTTGECVTDAAPDGTPCEDADACTVGDSCQSGLCASGGPVACEVDGPCAVASCDPEAGCVQTAVDDGTACDDGNPCTSGDACAAGACLGGASVCDCASDADCAPFQTDLCQAALVCVDGQCQVGLGQPVGCPPSDDPCLVSQCDPATGACGTTPAADGTTCGDPADACAVGATCQAGACVAAAGLCDDGNPCTTDVCDPIKGCGHLPAEGACDDGNACTEGDVCVEGACVGEPVCACESDDDCAGEGFDLCLGTWSCQAAVCVVVGAPVDCSKLGDGVCAVGACDATTGACVVAAVADGTACDDADPCTEGTVCAAGECGGGDTKVCNDGNPCTDDSCQAGKGCVHKPNSAPCDDGNACTVDEACAGGTCKGGVAVVCTGGGACATAVCDAVKGCGVVPKDDGEGCDDGNDCTSGDACVAGACVGESVCACEADADCVDDGDLCNGVPRCEGGACVVDPATVVTCDGGGVCESVTCDAATGACVKAPLADGTSCPAGPCKKGGACVGGVCQGADVDCSDGNPCTADSCDPATGQCVNAAVDGATCDDGDPCTLASVCQAGSCVGSVKNTCDDGNACTVDTCEPGVGCKHAPLPPCDDGDACTDDACDPAVGCTFVAKVCAPSAAPCTTSSCNPTNGQCQSSPVASGSACDDGDPCTSGDACSGGACKGQPVSCDDGDACTTDACGPTGCTHAPVAGCGVDPQCEGKLGGVACDDGDDATTADMCIAGKCRGYVVHRANGDALEIGHVGYHEVDYAAGKWFVVGSASPVWGGGSTYAIVDATNPTLPGIYQSTIQGYLFRDLHGGFAVDSNAALWQFDGTGWTATSPLANALYATGFGSLFGVWSQANPAGQRTLWVVGSANSQPYVRRCTEVGSVTCTVQTLGTTQARLPRAVTGYQACGANGCTTHLSLGADQSAGSGYYYNHTYDNAGGTQSPWSSGYNDGGAAMTQTTAIAAYGDGRFILVGTNGLMRFRATNGAWGNTVTVNNGQANRTFTGAWIGADVVVLSAWRATSTQRVYELWTADRAANGTAASSWTIHQLGTDGSGSANLADVRGREDGSVYAVGTGRGSDFYLDGVMFVRTP